MHLFLECQHSVRLWQTVFFTWGSTLSLEQIPNKHQLLLGDSGFSNIANHILLITKRVIYCARSRGSTPSFVVLKRMVSNIFQIESYIAERRNLVHLHLKKLNNFPLQWAPTWYYCFTSVNHKHQTLSFFFSVSLKRTLDVLWVLFFLFYLSFVNLSCNVIILL